MSRRAGYFALAVYGLSIVLANWMIRNVGTVVLPGGTHLLPVGFGLMAPSGVYAVGLILVARDFSQQSFGRLWSLAIIVPGIALVALLDLRLALASGVAFGLSELFDFAVYTPLQNRGFGRAVLASGCVGAVVDSVVFLSLAGIPLSLAPGQVLGKVEMVLIAAFIIGATRQRVTA